jgi:hypothetical protein
VSPDFPSTEELLFHLYALQNPSTSNWNIPFIRVFSRHAYTPKTLSLTVNYYVYFSRLTFELISDEAIKVIMEHITVTCDIKKCTSKIAQPSMFCKENAELLQLKDFRFSLPGLLKHVESTGYGYGLGYPENPALARLSQQAGRQAYTPPPGLKVNLYDFQKSTYLWMLDQEKDEAGLNGHFWEEWQLQDGGGALYYFPLGGEFRFSKPPIARGGLLCEEMGLGRLCCVVLRCVVLCCWNNTKPYTSNLCKITHSAYSSCRQNYRGACFSARKSCLSGLSGRQCSCRARLRWQ